MGYNELDIILLTTNDTSTDDVQRTLSSLPSDWSGALMDSTGLPEDLFTSKTTWRQISTLGRPADTQLHRALLSTETKFLLVLYAGDIWLPDATTNLKNTLARQSAGAWQANEAIEVDGSIFHRKPVCGLPLLIHRETLSTYFTTSRPFSAETVSSPWVKRNDSPAVRTKLFPAQIPQSTSRLKRLWQEGILQGQLLNRRSWRAWLLTWLQRAV